MALAWYQAVGATVQTVKLGLVYEWGFHDSINRNKSDVDFDLELFVPKEKYALMVETVNKLNQVFHK